MVRVCPKCGYERKADEPVPETECPQCGAIYAKIEQALRKAEEPEPQNPDPQEPQPDKDEPPSVEEKSAKLTAFLYEQSQLSREKTRTFGLAITVIPGLFFGTGLLFACWKAFGPLIIIAKVIDIQGNEGWTIVFADKPIAWAIVAGGVILPFLFLWYRNIRRSLRG